MTDLELSLIHTDGGTQPRDGLNKGHLQDLVEALEQGEQLKPMDVFYDGLSYWLSDGFHRHAAYQRKERRTGAVNIFQGTLRDAILHGIQSNAKHTALKLSREDKRRAVLLMLNDTEWSRWSDREIARRCGVSDRFVNKLRQGLTANCSQSNCRRGADGRVINTTKIGRSRTSSSRLAETEKAENSTSQPIEVHSNHAEEHLLGEVESEFQLDMTSRTSSLFPYLNRYDTAKESQVASVGTSWQDKILSTEPQGNARQVHQTSISDLEQGQSTTEPKPDCPDSTNQLEEELLTNKDAKEGSEPFGQATAPKARFKLTWFGEEIEVEGKIAAVLVNWQYQGRSGQTQVPIGQVSAF